MSASGGCIVDCDDSDWQCVNLPHNLEDYQGYQVESHGNLHGSAWYRRRIETPSDFGSGRRMFVEFEGVGSYATVYLNGVKLGQHAGGRTCFSVDVTSALHREPGTENLLAVKVDHPEGINDLPFVCGGCWGAPNTEGSQPFGIFRPVHLYCTGSVRTIPFGVHIWASEWDGDMAKCEVRTELHNYSESAETVHLIHQLIDEMDSVVAVLEGSLQLSPLASSRLDLRTDWLRPHRWTIANPYLYTLKTTVKLGENVTEETANKFGFRTIQWPTIAEPNADRNVRSMRTDRKLIHNGAGEISLANNGFTEQLQIADDPLAVIAPMGVTIYGAKAECGRYTLRFDVTVEGRRELRGGLLEAELQNDGGTVFFQQFKQKFDAVAGQCVNFELISAPIHEPMLWGGGEDPYLHKLVISLFDENRDALQCRTATTFGIRDTNTPLNLGRPEYETLAEACMPTDPVLKIPVEERIFRLNGETFFQNGSGGYEHNLGCDHAFTDEQVRAQALQVKASGFNCFRDAHHPHNLRYYDHWDEMGILCWTQMGSHIYFDNEAFRDNYRQLVREWVRERRNHPCIINYGIQNESILPEAFVEELRAIIIEEDPTVPNERITTTCNGGKGSDWNVPQEWSGTYGGNCNDYDLERAQMVGEYGAWRRFGVHREIEYLGDENDHSETWAAYNLGTKIAIAESQRNRCVGHYQWAMSSFSNPGRTAENFENSCNGAIGPVNYKGLFTAWHQPSDLYYLYRAAYAPVCSEPMVYIVSHSWPDRWDAAGIKDRLFVFSNCETVELFNDINQRSLGVRTNPGPGRPFRWDGVSIERNTLHAVGKSGGKMVAEDTIVLQGLPEAAGLSRFIADQSDSLDAAPLDEALLCINCGSLYPYTDTRGIKWLADVNCDGGGWRSGNWADAYPKLPPDLASRSFSMAPISGTNDPELYQTQRYGREQLYYHFDVTAGDYRLILHFAETWYGVGGGLDAGGWRLFDVAVNGQTRVRDLDIFAHVGTDHALVLPIDAIASARGGLRLSFPRVTVAQALIAGIELFRI